MANLTFSKSKGIFVSEEIVIDANFNLHLERKDPGACSISIKTADGQFSPATTIMGGTVIDIDVYAFVYPKTIVISSATEVDLGICSTSGTVTKPDTDVQHNGHFIFADGKHYITADGMYYKVKQ